MNFTRPVLCLFSELCSNCLNPTTGPPPTIPQKEEIFLLPPPQTLSKGIINDSFQIEEKDKVSKKNGEKNGLPEWRSLTGELSLNIPFE